MYSDINTYLSSHIFLKGSLREKSIATIINKCIHTIPYSPEENIIFFHSTQPKSFQYFFFQVCSRQLIKVWSFIVPGVFHAVQAKTNDNRPFPSPLPQFQNESWCTAFNIEMSFTCTCIIMQIKLISITKAVHQDSFWNRGKRKVRNGLFNTCTCVPSHTKHNVYKFAIWGRQSSKQLTFFLLSTTFMLSSRP